MLSTELAPACAAGLPAFLAGYLLILAAPGPNMLAVGSLAALRGLGGVLPMVCGIALGAATLGGMVLALLGDAARIQGLGPEARGLAGAMLLCVAGAILRGPPISPAPCPKGQGAAAGAAPAPQRRAGHSAAGFLAGFSTAASNPMTAAYFTASLVPMAHGGASGLPVAAMVGAILATAATFWLAVAALLARPPVRRFVQARQRGIRLGAALAIAAMALPMLQPLAARLLHAVA